MAQAVDSGEPVARDARASWVAVLLLILGCLVLLGEAVVTCLAAGAIYDEGGYLYEGWVVCARGWRLFQDFHTKVPPLIYYFYGAGQALLGPSVLVGRVQASTAALLGLGLGTFAAARIYGLWAATAVVWCFAAVFAGLDQHFRALAIAPCALWVGLGLLAVSGARTRWGPPLAGLAVGALLLSRHDLIGLAAGLLAGLALGTRSSRAVLQALVVAALVFVAGLAPFLVRAPGPVLNMLTFGLLDHGPDIGPAPFARTEPVSLSNLPWYAMFLTRAYVTPFLMLLLGLAFLASRTSSELSFRHPLIAAAFSAAALNLLIRGGAAALLGRNAFYLRDFYLELPLVVAAGAVVAQAARAARDPSFRGLVTLQAVAAVALGPAVAGLPDALRPGRPTALQGISDAGRFIAAHTRPEDRIFSIEDPYFFLEARRELLPLLTHNLFLYHPTAPTDALHGTHALNLDLLLALMRREATVVVLSRRAMGWVAQNERTTAGREIVEAVEDELARHWRLVADRPNSFAERIEIYRRAEVDRQGAARGRPGGPSP